MQKSLFQLFYTSTFEFVFPSVKNNNCVHFACAAAATHSLVPLVRNLNSSSGQHPVSTHHALQVIKQQSSGCHCQKTFISKVAELLFLLPLQRPSVWFAMEVSLVLIATLVYVIQVPTSTNVVHLPQIPRLVKFLLALASDVMCQRGSMCLFEALQASIITPSDKDCSAQAYLKIQNLWFVHSWVCIHAHMLFCPCMPLGFSQPGLLLIKERTKHI